MNCLPTACPQDLLGAGNTTVFSISNRQIFPWGLSQSYLVIWDHIETNLIQDTEINLFWRDTAQASKQHKLWEADVLEGTQMAYLPLWRTPVKCCDNSRRKHYRNMHKHCSTLSLDSSSSPNPFFFLIVNANEGRNMWKTSACYILSYPFWKKHFPFTYSKTVEAQMANPDVSGASIKPAHQKAKPDLWSAKNLCVVWHQYCIYWNPLDCYRIQDN